MAPTRVTVAATQFGANFLSKTFPSGMPARLPRMARPFLSVNNLSIEDHWSVVPRAAPDAATPDKPAGGWWTKDVPDNVLMVTNVQEMVDVLEQAAANDQLVVFECFAPWCGSCKALFHKMKKICKEHSDVRFVLLNFEENRKLAKGLGIKVLPFFHFYRGADGKVEELTASISKIDRIKDAITRHKSPRCYLPANGIRPYIREYPDVEPSAVKAEGQGSPEAAVL